MVTRRARVSPPTDSRMVEAATELGDVGDDVVGS